MSVIKGPLKINSGGKLKISSGKVSVDTHTSSAVGISLTFSVNHQNNGGNPFVARYSIGLTNTVTYSSGYILRGEATLPDDGVQRTLNLGTGFITGAVASDGTVDCFFHIEHGGDVGGETPYVDGFGGLGGHVETTLPNQSNNRYEVKLSASPATCNAVDVEWDFE